jgi:hypothetical protein
LAPCLADSAMKPGKTMTSHSEARKRITAKMDLVQHSANQFGLRESNATRTVALTRPRRCCPPS